MEKQIKVSSLPPKGASREDLSKYFYSEDELKIQSYAARTWYKSFWPLEEFTEQQQIVDLVSAAELTEESAKTPKLDERTRLACMTTAAECWMEASLAGDEELQGYAIKRSIPI